MKGPSTHAVMGWEVIQYLNSQYGSTYISQHCSKRKYANKTSWEALPNKGRIVPHAKMQCGSQPTPTLLNVNDQ